ncbi:MAG: hypothetical protein JW820_17410 [Spirochaetales bacterium]|nr:hypothetical protein [Spirochaetales bacterium]
MQIRINDQPLDITLEHNDTLGTVVRELQAWLKGSDLILYSVRHRDRDLLASPAEEWEGTSTSQVDALEVTVRQAGDLRSENLRTVLQYLELLDAALAQADDGKLAELTPGFAALTESVAQIAPREGSLPGLALLLEELSGRSLGDWPGERAAQARQLIERLRSLVDRRRREIDDPRCMARELVDQLPAAREEAQDVAVLLQTGRDREAMETIVRFSEICESVARVLHSLPEGDRPSVGGRNLEEFFTELNGLLNDLVEAFSAHDSVLIGDLMEYEVAPRLEQLQAALEAVL